MPSAPSPTHCPQCALKSKAESFDFTVVGSPAPGLIARVSELLGSQPQFREPALNRWLQVAPSAAVRQTCLTAAHESGCDGGFVPAGMKFTSVKALFFDMDHTSVQGETLDLLARAAGVYEPCRAIGDAVRAGNYPDYDQSLRERAALFAGKAESLVNDLGAQITLSPGLFSLVSQAKAQGIPSYLVSSNFSCLTQFALQQAPFTGACVNALVTREGKFTGEIRGPFADGALSDSPGKARFVRETMAKLHADVGSAISFGDGMNDIGMITVAAVGVGFRPSIRLRPHCDVLLDFHPFDAVIKFFTD